MLSVIMLYAIKHVWATAHTVALTKNASAVYIVTLYRLSFEEVSFGGLQRRRLLQLTLPHKERVLIIA